MPDGAPYMPNPSATLEPGLPDRDLRLSLFEAAISGTRNGIVITTPDGSILYVNPAFTEITGYSRDHVIGKNMRILQSGRQSQSFYEAMWVSLRTHDSWSGSVWNRRRDGEIYQEWLSINAISNELQETIAYVGMFSDISSIRSREHQLERMAYIDPLTELPNRLLFRDRLSQTIAFARKNRHGIALLIVDLDSVGAINERYGRLFGDRVLQSVSRRIHGSLDECDGVGRLAGDKFGIILSSAADMASTERAVEKIRAAIGVPFDDAESPITITASIGIARFPDDSDQAVTLVDFAELAMYAAKRDGGDRWRCYAQVHTQTDS
ncbi:MAG: diguanylate cyclase [Gammaproteobacteria bacterium]|nr:diguanylate cyclase [Gammaproteobacteria bacterium]MDX2458676.1 diguanylate cyclase [Gammaproteobacteria bacterium]